MQEANVSYNTLQSSINQLVKLNLLELRLSAERYVATEKGLKFLQTWMELQHFLTDKSGS